LRRGCHQRKQCNQRQNKQIFPHDYTFKNSSAKIIFFANAWCIQKNYIFAA
jgi:hypothetical protein